MSIEGWETYRDRCTHRFLGLASLRSKGYVASSLGFGLRMLLCRCASIFKLGTMGLLSSGNVAADAVPLIFDARAKLKNEWVPTTDNTVGADSGLDIGILDAVENVVENLLLGNQRSKEGKRILKTTKLNAAHNIGGP